MLFPVFAIDCINMIDLYLRRSTLKSAGLKGMSSTEDRAAGASELKEAIDRWATVKSYDR